MCLVGLIVLNSVLDNDPEGRRLQIKDFVPGDPASSLSLGNHFVTLYVGNPAQPQRLMISLASEFTSFPCKGCKNCGDQHTSPPFDFGTSLIHQCPNDCQFEKSRCEDGTNKCIVVSAQTGDEDTEGGFRGYEVRDTTYLDTTGERLLPTHRQGFIMDFVCQSSIRGMTQDSLSDGIISLSMAPSSFISQLYARGKVSARKFALCFSHVNHPQEDGSSIGSVHFGEFDRTHHESTLVWAMNVGKSSSGPGNYAVQIKNVYLGNGGGSNPLLSASQGTMSIIPIGKNIASFDPPEEWMRDAVIHTNKAITQLPKNYEEAFKVAFEQLVGVAYDPNGITMSEADLEALPTLFLQLQPHNNNQGGTRFDIPGFAGHLDQENHYDIILAIPAEHYFIYNHDTAVAAPTIQFSESISTIGAAALQGHELAFDLENNRIGFAEVSSCGESLSLVSPPTSAPTDTEGRQGGRTIGNQTGALETTDDGEARVNGTNATDIVVGAVSQPQEQTSGIPRADGSWTFHVGPGAVKASERLNEINSNTVMNMDYFHLIGFLVLMASFGITAFATRDKANDKKDVKFKDAEGPVLYDEDNKSAWKSTWQPPPPPPQSEHHPTREMEMGEGPFNDEYTQGEPEKPKQKQPSFQSVPSQSQEETPRRSIGLQMWSKSSRQIFQQKEKGFIPGLERRTSEYTEATASDGASYVSEGASHVSEEPSYYSQESDASYFVKKSPQPQQSQSLPAQHLSTVDEASETPDESAYQPDTSFSQQVPSGLSSVVDSMDYSDSYSTTMELKKQQREEKSVDAYTAASDDFAPESSSLPGLGTTSSLPGMTAYDEPEVFEEEPVYEVDDEELEDEEEQDYFPGPDEIPFVPGHTETGYLMARQDADDDQSLLTMEEFPDGGGSVATRETRDIPLAATQISEGTARHSNMGGAGR